MPAINDPTQLRHLALFRDLPQPELALLNGLMRQQLLAVGARIQMTEQVEDTTYVVQSGRVKLVGEQPDGTELIVSIVGPSDVIGALTLGECSDVAHWILSIDETKLFCIDRKSFEKCLQTMPTLSANLSTVLGRRIQLANERIEALAGMDVRGRLVRHLLLLAREHGQAAAKTNGPAVRIPLRLTQADLAHLVGASRVRVNQALSELRRRGLVATDGDRFVLIHDMRALERLR